MTIRITYLDGDPIPAGVCAVCFDEQPDRDHCSEPIPEGMWVVTSRITGERSAVCDWCGFRSFLWECGCELAHECEGRA
jgi:hypothetical protein